MVRRIPMRRRKIIKIARGRSKKPYKKSSKKTTLNESIMFLLGIVFTFLLLSFFYPHTFNTGKYMAINFFKNVQEIIVSDADISTITKIRHIDNKTLMIEKEVLEYTNKERIKIGLQPLIWDDKLADVARKHSLDMIQRNFFDHINPDGQGPTERYAEMWGGMPRKSLGWGYYTEGIAENIGRTPIGRIEGGSMVFDTPSSVASNQVSSWMESSGHRGNILDTTYSHSGVGVARDNIGEYYITQVFW
jgi:uncharacterized protein YkwD